MQLLAKPFGSATFCAVSFFWLGLAQCYPTPVQLDLTSPTIDSTAIVPSGQKVIDSPDSEHHQLISYLTFVHTGSILETASVAGIGISVALWNLHELGTWYYEGKPAATFMDIPVAKVREVVAWIVVGLFLASAITWLVTYTHNIVKVRSDTKPVVLAGLMKDACGQLNELAAATEGAAEDEHGVDRWQKHWTNFESIFESAEDLAHSKVMANLTSLPVDRWPEIPTPPELSETPTTAEEPIFHKDFTEWGRENLMTIPRIKHDIAVRYMNMHTNETMEAVWQQNNHPVFVNNSMVFEQLSRTFLFRSSLPLYCVPQVKEPKSVFVKMIKMRKKKEVRDSAVKLKSLFEAKNEFSKKSLA